MMKNTLYQGVMTHKSKYGMLKRVKLFILSKDKKVVVKYYVIIQIKKSLLDVRILKYTFGTKMKKINHQKLL